MKIYNISSLNSVHNILTNIYNNSHESYKVHISFGYVFMNKTTSGVTVNSPTTKFYSNEPQVIRFKSNLNKLLNKITDHSIKYEIDHLLPNTQSQLMGVYLLGVKIYGLGYKVGTCIKLPNHITKSRRIISLDKVENNLCFWACCALMHGARRDKYITKTKELFIKYYGLYNNNYKGFDYISELPKFEDTFEYGINIVQYKSDESIKYVYRSKYQNKLQKYINLFEYHFSYITDIDKLAKMYVCNNCASKFRCIQNLTQHNNVCKAATA